MFLNQTVRGGTPCRSGCISAASLTQVLSCSSLVNVCAVAAHQWRKKTSPGASDNNFSSFKKKKLSSAGDELLQFLQNAARSRHLVVRSGSARKQASLFCTFSGEFPPFLIIVTRKFNQMRVCVFFSTSLRAVILSQLLDQKVAVTIGALVRHGQGEVFRRSRSCASQRN